MATAFLFVATLAITAPTDNVDAPRPNGPTDGAAARAGALFAAAQAAFSRGAYADALAGFEQAFALAPHAAVRFNIAVCHERLGQHRRAIQQYLAAAASEELDGAQRQRAREAAARATLVLGTIDVTAPAGAKLFVDGEATCDVPCAVELDPGAHVLAAQDSSGLGAATTVNVVTASRRALALTGAAPPPALTTSAQGTAGPDATPRDATPRDAPPRDDVASAPAIDAPRVAAIGGSGVFALGVGAGAVLGAVALSIRDTECTPYCASAAVQQRGELTRNAANVAYGVGALGAAVGLVGAGLVLLHAAENATAPSAAPPPVY